MPKAPEFWRGGFQDLGAGLTGDPLETIDDAPAVDIGTVAISGFGFFVGGLMADSELLGACVFPKDMTIEDGDPLTRVETIVPPAADADLHIKATTPGPSPTTSIIGTIHIAAGTYSGTVTWAGSPYKLTKGTMLLLYGPSPADSSLALLTGTINGSPT